MINIEQYSLNHYQFIQPLPHLLEVYLSECLEIKSVLDIGCGDGTTLIHLKNRFPNANLTGVDLSPERISRLNEHIAGITTCVGDANNLAQLHGNNYDLIISSQVIEHVASDDKMLQEIHKLIAKTGTIYISSVVKKWYGWWIYKCQGKITCDPTHVREYGSSQEFKELIERNGFQILKLKATPYMPSFFHFFIRALVRKRIIKQLSINKAFLKYPRFFNFLHKAFSVWAPGYFIIEVIATPKVQ